MNRVLVIGTSGSGKTTLATALSQRLGLPVIPSDHFYWASGWRPVPVYEVERLIEDAVNQTAWVSGDHSSV